MANISNLNRLNSSNTGINEKKISFSKGDIFNGKIKTDSSGKIVVELKDGWMFEALFEGNVEENFDKEAFLKVVGYSNGKLKLQVIDNFETDYKKDSNEEVIEEGFNLKSIGLNKEDMSFIKSLLKHNIPLTKENVSDIKSLINFRNRLINNNEESSEFINKFLISKDISKDSIEGKNIVKALEGFTEKFKNLTDDDILLLKNSGIDFNEENIKALDVIKKDNGVIKTLSDLKDSIFKDGEVIENFKKDIDLIESNDKSQSYLSLKDINEKSEIITNTNNQNSKEIVNDIKKINVFEKYFSEDKIEDSIKEFINTNNNEDKGNINEFLKSSLKDIIDKPIEKILDKLNSNEFNNDEKEIISKFKDFILDKFKDDVLELKYNKENIKESIELQSKDIKDLVKSLLKENVDVDKVVTTFKDQFTAIKVFNNLSKEMYILDVPVKVKEDTYDCKLIVKDERGKGKKIDSSNVRLFASVSTINMGDVDAIISVLDKNLNVNLKIKDEFISVIEKSKNILVDRLREIGYSPVINVTERTEKTDVSSVIDLLEEEYSKGLNVRV
ncbi:hypothetical protein [uncultured Clostridium sp.]|uniref:hypothetical protein n=1 Tax=uncultured Clostridium sp. TaxID=59620 RepID=UPI0025F5E7F5|nr:hypothetical protein [uncultured Clostridium sp.]